MQPMLQDMAVFNSRLAQQEAATRATPWAPGPARAAAAMHGAPPHGVDVGASSDLNHSAFPFGAGEGTHALTGLGSPRGLRSKRRPPGPRHGLLDRLAPQPRCMPRRRMAWTWVHASSDLHHCAFLFGAGEGASARARSCPCALFPNLICPFRASARARSCLCELFPRPGETYAGATSFTGNSRSAAEYTCKSTGRATAYT